MSSKGKTNSTIGGTIPSPADDQRDTTEDIGSFSPPRAASNIQLTPFFKGQIFQVLVDMKEQMKEQQIRSNHDREQATLDSENVACEQEALKCHNDQLLAQIATL